MIGTFVAALVLFQLKHFLCDYVLQTPYQLANKGTYGHPGGILHAGLHVLGTLPILVWLGAGAGLAAAILAAEFVVHYHIDWAKEQIVRRYVHGQGAGFWRMIGLDQLLHQLTYSAILLVLFT